MAYNKIITSEGNVQFQSVDGQIINVHPFHIYTTFNEDTVSFILIAMPKQSGLAIFTSKASDLEVDGTVYTIDELPNALSEAFAKAGAVARYEIVDELPTSGQSNTIYLVPKSEGVGYDEYIYVNGEWELIGDTDIELDRYVTKEVFSGYTADTLVLINTVSGDVETEVSRATSAETALQTAIDNEVSARTDADSALQGLIDTVSGNVETETSRATSAETDLQTAINDEASARTEADEALSGAIDSVSSALTAETSARTEADTALGNKIDGKVVELTQAEYDALVDKDPLVLYVITDAVEVNMNDYYKKTETSGATELSTAFANEASARTDADNALQDNIDIISGNVATVSGSVESLGDNKANKSEAVASAEYVSSSTTIDLKDISGNVISQVDASDFIIDGMVDDVKIENGYLVITFNTDSGKQDIQIPLSSIFDPSDYYDKTAIDDIVSGMTERMSEDEEVAAAGIVKVNSDLTTHTANTTIHVTASEKQTWNGKADWQALNEKQDILSAGTGISIEDLETSSIYDLIKINPDQSLNRFSNNVVQNATLFNELRIVDEDVVTELVFDIDNTSTNYPSGCTRLKLDADVNFSSTDFELYDENDTKVADINVYYNGYNFEVTTNPAEPFDITIGDGVLLSYSSLTVTKVVVPNGLVDYTLSAVEYGTETPLINQVVENTSIISGINDTIIEDERITAQALNDLNSRKLDASAYTPTSAVTSGSTDVVTSGGVYEQIGGLKLIKLTQQEYDALSPNYDSDTLYVIV